MYRERLPPFQHLAAELLGFALGFRMGHEDRASNCGDKAVPEHSCFHSRPAYCIGIWREEQHPALFERLLVRCRDSHAGKASGRTHNDRLRAAKEDCQAFLFHRRMKPADHGDTGLP